MKQQVDRDLAATRAQVEYDAGRAISAIRNSDQQVYEQQMHDIHDRYRQQQAADSERQEAMQLELEAARREALAARRETQAMKTMVRALP